MHASSERKCSKFPTVYFWALSGGRIFRRICGLLGPPCVSPRPFGREVAPLCQTSLQTSSHLPLSLSFSHSHISSHLSISLSSSLPLPYHSHTCLCRQPTARPTTAPTHSTTEPRAPKSRSRPSQVFLRGTAHRATIVSLSPPTRVKGNGQRATLLALPQSALTVLLANNGWQVGGKASFGCEERSASTLVVGTWLGRRGLPFDEGLTH